MITPGRQAIIIALRSDMPRGFIFNFNIPLVKGPEAREAFNCDACGCAWGLAFILGLVPQVWEDRIGHMAKLCGISEAETRRTFWDGGTYVQKEWSDVTPQMVADRLEALP